MKLRRCQLMPCTYHSGGLQLHIYERRAWRLRCLNCGAVEDVREPGFPTKAGEAAFRGFLCYEQRRFDEAARAFEQAFEISSDIRYRFAALLCSFGVTWCGNELQPTFGVYPLPAGTLAESEQWRFITDNASSIGAEAFRDMQQTLNQLEEILGFIRANEGRTACDIFLCYRRTPAALQSALSLYSDLTAAGMRVFCADVTTRGKRQEQFESEVYHALKTCEYLVLFPGEETDALTPWLRNELERAIAPKNRRYICTTSSSCTPAEVSSQGNCMPLEDVRAHLLKQAEDCNAARLMERAVEALKVLSAEAIPLLRRASAHGSAAARLMLAEMYCEGLLLPADAALSAACRTLAADVTDRSRRTVYDAVAGLEKAMNVQRRKALIYLIANVSDAGFISSQALIRSLMEALNDDRRLADAEVCLIGYDRHARVLSEPKLLTKYGLPDQAARTLHTTPEAGCDRFAYAAKGLRCAADHLRRSGSAGRAPFALLLTPCPTDDQESAVPAALTALQPLFSKIESISSAGQIAGCIAGLR